MEFIAHKQIGLGKEKSPRYAQLDGRLDKLQLRAPYLNTDDYVFVDLRGYGRSKEMRGGIFNRKSEC